uniref:Cyclin N-terminal domain-containing protein n=1 Tax=Meloidogyne incognita TaxID=6306 RepID=A0A914M1Z0_MELIC
MTEPVPSSSKLGKKPKWYFADDELARLPSRMSMDSATELKYRREAAEFIQEMAERLNHNIPQHRGQINQNCICIAMIHMHRFFTVHAFSFFNMYKEVAAACLFLASKSEECPRKLEHVVEVWFRLKFRKAEVQPPFNEAARKNGAQLLVYLEGILLQTIGFELHVDLPHPIVIINMKKFKQESQKLTECAYWFATDIIQLTNWCIRFNERTIACVCIYLACSWADYEVWKIFLNGFRILIGGQRSLKLALILIDLEGGNAIPSFCSQARVFAVTDFNCKTYMSIGLLFLSSRSSIFVCIRSSSTSCFEFNI